MTDSNEWRVLEFYCGIGGMHYALQDSGVSYNVVGAYDINETALTIYKHNWPATPIHNSNICGLTVQSLCVLDAHVWTMSPPCQPFTRQGKRMHEEDSRTDSFKHLMLLLKSLPAVSRPRHLLLENVHGFEDSEPHNQFVHLLTSLQYKVQRYLLTPLQLAMPNSRLRFYLLATLGQSEIDSSLSVSISIDPIQTIMDIDECLSPDVYDQSPGLIQPISTYLDSSAVTECLQLPASVLTKNVLVMDIVTPLCKRSCCFTRAYGSYARGTGSVLYEEGDKEKLRDTFSQFALCSKDADRLALSQTLNLRYFAPREIARLMGYPDTFDWPECTSRKHLYRTLGNSVNVKVIGALFRLLLQANKHTLLSNETMRNASATAIEIDDYLLFEPPELSSKSAYKNGTASSSQVVIYIRSAPHEGLKRERLRLRWIAEARRSHFKICFVVGKHARNELNMQLYAEIQNFHDFIVFDFVDAYSQLNLKNLLILKYHVSRFASAIFMWSNLDTMILPANLKKYIETDVLKGLNESVMFGECSCSGPCLDYEQIFANHNLNDRWYISWRSWPYKYYPGYCIGYALCTPSVAGLILKAYEQLPKSLMTEIWIDDVLFTGVYRREAGVLLKSNKEMFRNAVYDLPKCDQCVAVHVNSRFKNMRLIYDNYLNSLNHSMVLSKGQSH